MKKKNFGKYSFKLKYPDLVEFQISAYREFIDQKLKKLFEEFSPIKDYSEKEYKLYFKDFKFEKPKLSDHEAKENNLSYLRLHFY